MACGFKSRHPHFNSKNSELERQAMSWRERAKCKGKGPEFFYPKGLPGRVPKNEKAERRDRDAMERMNSKFCKGTDDNTPCEVLDECLDWALGALEPGVWGGTSEEERRVMIRRRSARIRHGVAA